MHEIRGKECLMLMNKIEIIECISVLPEPPAESLCNLPSLKGYHPGFAGCDLVKCFHHFCFLKIMLLCPQVRFFPNTLCMEVSEPVLDRHVNYLETIGGKQIKHLIPVHVVICF